MTVAPDPRLLRNQFVLSRTDAGRATPPGWDEARSTGWALQYHPELPVRPIRGAGTGPGGWLLGWPVVEGSLVPAEAAWTHEAATPEALEESLYELGGRWLAVLVDAAGPRVYLDPSGSLAVLYSTEEPVLASTCSALGKTPGDPDWDAELVAAVPQQWYPFGLSPHTTLRRLLPGHYFDLDAWRAVRHWPRPGLPAADSEAGEPIGEIITAVSEVMGASFRAGAYGTLTAGRDTRVLLACARDLADRTTFFTSDARPADVMGARRLARRFGLRHVTVRDRYATAEERATRLMISGYSTDPGSVYIAGDHRRKLDPDRLQTVGLGAVVGKGFYWRDAGPPARVEPAFLLRAMKMPAPRVFMTAAEEWLAALSCFPPDRVLDLAALEHRAGAWAGPNGYALDALTLPVINGYNHRRAYEAMLRLPFEMRRTKGMSRAIIERLWPELLELPFNELTGVDRVRYRVRKGAGTLVRTLLGAGWLR